MPIHKFTLHEYKEEERELLEYVYILAQLYKPDVDFDEETQETYLLESQAPEIFKVRYNKEQLKSHFTYQSYVKNRKIIIAIKQLGLDPEKFWYLLLFIYDYCRGQFIEGWECSPNPKKELETFCFSVLNEYKNDSVLNEYKNPLLCNNLFEHKVEVTLKVGGRKIISMQNYAIMYLAELCYRHLDEIEENSKMTTCHLKPWQSVSASTAIIAHYFANMLIDFFNTQNNIIAKRHLTVKGVSGKEKKLISQLIYFVKFITNDSLLDNYDYLKTLLKRYKSLSDNSFNSIYM